MECRARLIEQQSHSITQRELFFSNLYSGILMGPAQMLQRAAQLGISLAAGAYQIILTELDGVIPDRGGAAGQAVCRANGIRLRL